MTGGGFMLKRKINWITDISSVLLNCNDAFYTDDAGNFVNIYGSRNAGMVKTVCSLSGRFMIESPTQTLR